jgi:hypothetical protein
VRWLRRRRYAGIDFLDLVPEHAVAHEVDSGGDRIVLLMPRFQGTVFYGWLQRFLRGSRRYIRVPLDERGSLLWRRIDGRTPVRSLVESFVTQFPDDAEDASERVCRYVYSLEQNRFVRFVNIERLRATVE